MTPGVGWFPLALADDIEPGTSAGTRLFGRELVVWRDEAGASHVWEDRCPHRGMRLSFGFVRGSHIACLYHGWRFDTGGRCRFIPAHPGLDVPSSIAVERLTSAERFGLVWVRAGDESEAGPPPAGETATVPVRSLWVTASGESVMAALATAGSPFDAEGIVVIDRAGPLVTLRSGADRLYAAVQPVAPGEAAVHLALAEAGTVADRRRVSLWAQALRRMVEEAAA